MSEICLGYTHLTNWLGEHDAIVALILGVVLSLVVWNWQMHTAHRIKEREIRAETYAAYFRSVSYLAMSLHSAGETFSNAYAEAASRAEAAAMLLPDSERDTVLFFMDLAEKLRWAHCKDQENFAELRTKWKNGFEKARVLTRRDYGRHQVRFV